MRGWTAGDPHDPTSVRSCRGTARVLRCNRLAQSYFVTAQLRSSSWSSMTTNIEQHAFAFVCRCLQRLRPRAKSPRARDWALVQRIRAMSADMAALSDQALSDLAQDLRYK